MYDFDDHVAVYERVAKLLDLETDSVARQQATFGKYVVFTEGGSGICILEHEDSSVVIWHNDSYEPVDQEMLQALKRHLILDELSDV